MAAPGLIRCKDSDALAVEAAGLVIRCEQEAVRDRGRFTLVLAGGSTPEKTYGALAEPDRARAVDWSKTFVFFGDERLVPPDHAWSNFAMAHRTLLAQAPVPASHVFAVPTVGNTAAEAAAAYAETLRRFFSATANDPPPRFDLILLGLGEDGHTASLFPGSPALRGDDAWVTCSPPGTLPPPVDRVTMTYPVLNAARHVAFLVAGQGKAAALRDVFEGRASRDVRPAVGVRPEHGTVTWLVDEDAATLLCRSGFPA